MVYCSTFGLRYSLVCATLWSVLLFGLRYYFCGIGSTASPFESQQ